MRDVRDNNVQIQTNTKTTLAKNLRRTDTRPTRILAVSYLRFGDKQVIQSCRRSHFYLSVLCFISARYKASTRDDSYLRATKPIHYLFHNINHLIYSTTTSISHTTRLCIGPLGSILRLCLLRHALAFTGYEPLPIITILPPKSVPNHR